MMTEAVIRSVYFRERKPLPYRRIVEVVDAESGEVLLQKWEDDIAQALAAGEKSMQATFRITVDEREDGTACCHTFATEDGYLEAVWKKPRRRRAQRYRFVMLYFEKVLALGPRERESLLQIAPNMRRDGRLMQGARALDAEGLADLWQVGRSAAYERISALKAAGALEKREDGYWVSKDFLRRG